MAGYRHRARSAATQCIVGSLLRGISFEDKEQKDKLISFVKSEFLTTTKEEDFFYALIEGVLEKRNIIAESIKKYAPKWEVKSLPAVDRAILEIGIFELLETDTPIAIIINEAVEISKEFGDEGTPKFINGVLSALSKSDEIKIRK